MTSPRFIEESIGRYEIKVVERHNEDGHWSRVEIVDVPQEKVVATKVGQHYMDVLMWARGWTACALVGPDEGGYL